MARSELVTMTISQYKETQPRVSSGRWHGLGLHVDEKSSHIVFIIHLL